MYSTVSERIKKIRSILKLNQTEFGEKLGLSQANVTDLERGKTKPNFETITNMVCFYNINPTWLTTGEGNPFLNQDSNNNLDISKNQGNISGFAVGDGNKVKTVINDNSQERIRILEAQNKLLQDQITFLEDTIKEKNATIEMLRDLIKGR